MTESWTLLWMCKKKRRWIEFLGWLVHKIIDFDCTESEKEMGDNDVLISPQRQQMVMRHRSQKKLQRDYFIQWNSCQII